MKKMIRLWIFALASTLMVAACNDGNTNQENTDSGNVENNSVDSDDAEFIADAYYDGLKEIEAGKIAQEKAESQVIKDLAAMIVADHTAMGEKLRAIASSKNITLRDSLSRDDRDDIDSRKTGKDFDRWYADEMMDEHEDAVEDFEEASKNAKDPEIRALAAEGLPKLQHHMEAAKLAKEKVKGK